VADLETATGAPIDRNRLLVLLLAELAAVLERFAADGFALLREEWQTLHAHQNQPVCLTLPDGRQETGYARGVADDGVLLLETAGGITRHHSGEVSLRPARAGAGA
jgi:BirA family biotin operon repressor/biotin-[acetyl-CoA-carboxylase] ligase